MCRAAGRTQDRPPALLPLSRVPPWCRRPIGPQPATSTTSPTCSRPAGCQGCRGSPTWCEWSAPPTTTPPRLEVAPPRGSTANRPQPALASIPPYQRPLVAAHRQCCWRPRHGAIDSCDCRESRPAGGGRPRGSPFWPRGAEREPPTSTWPPPTASRRGEGRQAQAGTPPKAALRTRPPEWRTLAELAGEVPRTEHRHTRLPVSRIVAPLLPARRPVVGGEQGMRAPAQDGRIPKWDSGKMAHS